MHDYFIQIRPFTVFIPTLIHQALCRRLLHSLNFFIFFSLSEPRVPMNNWTVPRSKCHSRENCLRWLVIRIFIVCYVGLRFLSFHIPPYLGDGRYRWAGLSGETLKVEMERWHGNTINLHTQHHPPDASARSHTHTHTLSMRQKHTLKQGCQTLNWLTQCSFPPEASHI